MNYQIISDGACDLPKELTESNNIEIIPFYVSFDTVNYQKEMIEVEVREFYQQMVDHEGVYPKSACPSSHDYYEIYEKYVKQGISILSITITEKFSGSMQAAMTAKDMLLEEYPDAKIEIVDSMMNTVLEGLFVLEAVKLRDRGATLEETVAQLLETRDSGRIFFTVGDTEYLAHGGRIGKVANIAASLLNIKPLITMKEGEIFSSGVAHSRKKSMSKVMELLMQYIKEFSVDMKDYSLCIGYGYSKEEAEQFCTMALDKLGALGVKEIPMYQIGATVGVHTGPYPLGFGIIKCAK